MSNSLVISIRHIVILPNLAPRYPERQKFGIVFRSSQWRCSILEKLFLKISQYSQENTGIEVSFF